MELAHSKNVLPLANLPQPSAVEEWSHPAQQSLERVLASKIFEASPQMRKLLRYIVTQTLGGDLGALKEYPIGLEVFGRGRDYDPRLDPVVRVEARRLRAKLAEYYDTRAARTRLSSAFRREVMSRSSICRLRPLQRLSLRPNRLKPLFLRITPALLLNL